MDKKAVFALGLSLLVLIAYQVLMSRYYPKASVTPPAKSTVIVQETVKPAEEKPRPAAKADLPTGKVFVFENKLYTVTFTDVGGTVRKITLNKNPKAGLNIPYDILASADSTDNLFSFLPEDTGLKLNSVRYDTRQSGDEIIFTHTFGSDFILEKKYIMHNSLYRIELELSWKNISGRETHENYSLITGIHPPTSQMDERFIEVSGNVDGKVFKNKRSGKAYLIVRKGLLSWVMLKNRYSAVISRSFTPANGYIVQQYTDGTIVSAINMGDFTIAPNSNTVQKYGVYIGPANLHLAKESNLGIEGALQYGFLGSIGQILMDILKFFHRVTRNWGVSIILLDLFINIVLFPLSRKSYKSMHEMQMLQPKIEKLRQECKNNPQKLQKETMELYKKHKINPMGGCLPLLLQMPIFFALYQSLVNFIDMRGAGFLWVKDLSTTENLPLPVTLPLIGNTINILPLLMVAVTFLQQRLTNRVTSMSQTDEQRKQQKFMMVFMTIMFGFIFYNLPSGFVLYWLSSTIVMTVIQSVLTKGPVTVEAHA